jgi:hypothetical protein
MNDLGPRRYVLLNTQTDELHQDDMLTPDEADNINSRLAGKGEPYRWQPYGARKGDVAA